MGDHSDARVVRRYAHFMRMAYAWPEDGIRVTLKLYVECLARICMYGIFTFIGSIFYVYRSKQGDLTSERLNIIWNLLELSIMLLSSTYLLFIKGTQYIAFLRKLTKYSDNPGNIERLYKRQEKTIIFIYYIVKLFCLIFVLNNYFRNINCDGRNIYHDPRFICGLAIATWYPIELDFFPVKQLLVLSNLFYCWSFVPAFSSSAVMVLICVELIVVRIELLRKHMLGLIAMKEVSSREFEREFLWCIKYHSQIEELVHEMNEVLGYYFVSQYSQISTLLAVLVYKITDDLSAWNIIHLIIWLVIETIFCSCGQHLENEAESLVYCICDIPWYDLPQGLRSNFKIFLSRLQMPVHLKAPPILAMNNQCLLVILRAVFSFITFLRKLSHK